jgi:hypothetical protein
MKPGLALTEEDLEVVGVEEEDPIMVAEAVIKIGESSGWRTDCDYFVSLIRFVFKTNFLSSINLRKRKKLDAKQKT